MKKLLPFFFTLFPVVLFGQNNLKALVGGTLIDGFGGTPIRNSIINFFSDCLLFHNNQQLNKLK